MSSRIYVRFFKNPIAVFGFAIALTLALVGIFGPFFLSDNSLQINLFRDLQAPSSGNLGYAENGVDIISWLVIGARVSLIVATICTIISVTGGILYGAISGFIGGKIDALMMRIIDVLLSFPGLLLAIYIAAILKPSLFNIVLALCSTGWVGYARLVRAQVLALKQREFVVAAQTLGASPARILLKHILPNCLGPIIIEASFGFSAVILAEASLSFLGLGVPPGTPSWGALLDQGVAHLFFAPHIAIFSGICIAISVLGFNLLGDGLRDVLDSRN